MARADSNHTTGARAHCALQDAVEKLPRYSDDHSGMFETEHGGYLLRADVLNLVASCQGERQ
jgi:hypothetical protein